MEQWNEALHYASLNHELILEKDYKNKIRPIYEVGPSQISKANLVLMKHPVKHQLQLPLTTKCQWLESIAITLHQK